MSNIKFYIYGVPDGFNMLSGTHDEILYYQLFYDTSKKSTEMRINRKTNGETIYSYLKYNLVSCKGREGAFLGMSVAFHDFEYCDNPEKLKELFEAVYNDVILKADDNDKIVTKVDGGNAVGRFCVSKFAERQTMCEKIGRIVIQNVVGELKKHIKRWDDSGESIKVGCLLELPFNSDNSKIIQALRSYSWVSVSTGYFPPPSDTHKPDNEKLSVHYINELAGKVTAYKDFIIQGLKGLVSQIEISVKREEVNSLLGTIEKYAGKQPDLLPLREQYIAIYNEIVNLLGTGTDPKPKPKPSHKKYHLPLGHIAMVCCAVTVMVCLFLLRPQGETPTYTDPGDIVLPETQHEFDLTKFHALLDNADYNAAFAMVSQEKTDTAGHKDQLLRSYDSWFAANYNKAQNNIDNLNSLQQEVVNYTDFGQDKDGNKRRIHERINELTPKDDERKGSTGNPSNTNLVPTVHEVKIYHTNVDYHYNEENLIVGNIIRAKIGDRFMITGAKKIPQNTTRVEFNQYSDKEIRARIIGVGSDKVTINDTIYTFNITR
ncbi:MAG: hypothetical protein K2J00_07015 [Bacteroidaceae bacterium]|nr:hypothetical protein [Bacteroidaceae bacterium]